MNSFRIEHNKKVAKLFNWFFIVHVIGTPLLAVYYKTEISIAIAGSLIILITNYMALKFWSNSKLLVDINVTNAIFSFVLVVYLMRGLPEAHFHFFVFMSFLIAYAMPRAIVLATILVSIHHLSFYFFLPGIGFPVDYPFELYAIHFVAAVAQAVPSLIISYHAAKIVDIQGNIMQDLKIQALEGRNHSSILVNVSDQVDQTITSQAQAIDETVATLDQISSMMDSNMASIEKAMNSVNTSYDSIGDSKQTMDQMSTAILEMDRSNREFSDKVNKIAESFNEIVSTISHINSKTNVVNEITLQTKLLSFNASVEAARAGEYGKGFSVVANEVGQLAQTSSLAAEDINKLTTESSLKINDLLNKIEELLDSHLTSTKSKVDNAVNLVHKSLSTLDIVYQNMSILKNIFENITNASKEQSLGFSNIHDAVRVFQDHIRSSQEIITSSKNLSHEMDLSSKQILNFVSSLNKDFQNNDDNSKINDNNNLKIA